MNDNFISKCDELLSQLQSLKKPLETIAALQDGINANTPIQLPDYYIDFIGGMIKSMNVINVLEIGTLYGYTASILANNFNINMITLEHCNNRYQQATKIIKLHKNIQHINKKAQKFLTDYQGPKLDLIIIDANKNEYHEYLQLLKPHLKIGSIICADNVLKSMNRQYMVRNNTALNLNKFLELLQNKQYFNGKIYPQYGGFAAFQVIKIPI